MMYELWETSSGNLIGSYSTQDEALSVVREAIGRHGEAYVETIALVEEAEPQEEDFVPLRESEQRLITTPRLAGTVARSVTVAQGKNLAKLAGARF